MIRFPLTVISCELRLALPTTNLHVRPSWNSGKLDAFGPNDRPSSSMSQPQPTVVTLSTCPTGGWLMGNRHVLAAAIKDELGGEWEVALVWIAGLR